MTMTVQVAQRGVITLPKALRQTYNLKPGDRFSIIDLGEGKILLARDQSRVDEIADQIRNELEQKGESLESMLNYLREVRERYGVAES
jgi:AbrB family looped-hinge helix DNA binding protein